jgi:branched-chain amino acid transport system permease protein
MKALPPFRLAGLAVLACLLVFPWVATPFWIVQIGAQTMVLGIIALSLVWLAGYGGMVSMAQLVTAGLASYVVAYFGMQSDPALGYPLPGGLNILLAIAAGTLFGIAIGLIAVRCYGIYMIMITLAIAVGFFYLARQNMGFFNAYNGFHGIHAPALLGVSLRDPIPFYYLCLFCGLALYAFVVAAARTPLGLALQGIRDNPRRMHSLGYNVALHRVVAFGIAGFIAAVGGVLRVWYAGSVSPGSVGVGTSISILMIAILGGMTHPVGAFVGALLFNLIQNFAIDFIDRERFNTMIGLILLAIILFMPNGLVGLVDRLRRHERRGDRPPRQTAPDAVRPSPKTKGGVHP